MTDDSAVIWRYVSLPVLLQMLQRRTLFFPSLATLAEIDPWEGRWSSQEEPAVRRAFQEFIVKRLEEVPIRKDVDEAFRKADLLKIFQEAIRERTFISCWHENPDESAAMWAIYGAHHGIALRSTVGRLKAAFASEERSVAILRVKYGVVLESGPHNAMEIAFRKRHSFSHERELRAFVSESSTERGDRSERGSGYADRENLPLASGTALDI